MLPLLVLLELRSAPWRRCRCRVYYIRDGQSFWRLSDRCHAYIGARAQRHYLLHPQLSYIAASPFALRYPPQLLQRTSIPLSPYQILLNGTIECALGLPDKVLGLLGSALWQTLRTWSVSSRWYENEFLFLRWISGNSAASCCTTMLPTTQCPLGRHLS